MAKLVNPLLSLEAHGTLADTVTYQRIPGIDIARTKPVPTGARSLAQCYVRWRYQDYVELWRTLSTIQKQAYRSAANRNKTTLFGQYLHEQLLARADIGCELRLDEGADVSPKDTGPNLYTLYKYGTTPVPGRISLARHFDGLDDRIVLVDPPLCRPNLATFSIQVWLRTTQAAQSWIFDHDYSTPIDTYSAYKIADGRIIFRLYKSGSGFFHYSTSVVNDGQWHLLTCVKAGATWRILLDDHEDASGATVAGTINAIGYLGFGYQTRPYNQWFLGDLDHFVFYRREVTLTQHLKQYERGYPK